MGIIVGIHLSGVTKIDKKQSIVIEFRVRVGAPLTGLVRQCNKPASPGFTVHVASWFLDTQCPEKNLRCLLSGVKASAEPEMRSSTAVPFRRGRHC